MLLCADYLAMFATAVPSLIELEEPLCVLFQRLGSDENPSVDDQGAGGGSVAPSSHRYHDSAPSKGAGSSSAFTPRDDIPVHV